MKRISQTFRYHLLKTTFVNPFFRDKAKVPTWVVSCLCLILWWGMSCTKTEESTSTTKEVNDTAPSRTRDNAEVILFFGNSLTAGYGVDPEDAFPALIQEKIDSLSLPYRVINAGLSGETTASGVNRIEWVLREPAAIVVLELGGNDGLRGIDPEETRSNLQEILDRAKNKYPEIRVVLAGMEAPPNMGERYTASFRSIFPDLAGKNDIPLIPFLLEGVAGEPQYNLEDGIHPNEQGHRLVAENVWTVLQLEIKN